MPIYELYSERKRKQESSGADVYQYDAISNKLANQILMILKDILDRYQLYGHQLENEYDFLRNTLCREYGESSLSQVGSARETLLQWFIRSATLDEKLDLIELAFCFLEVAVKPHAHNYHDGFGNFLEEEKIDEAITELNYRFKADSTGYQYINQKIIRIDSEFIHAEVVKPVLKLLNETGGYEGALEEFMSAHEHFRHGKHKECLVDCLKSFESVMKVIHIKRGWDFDAKRSSARDLINGCLKNHLIPQYMQTQFSALNNLLESGVPTIRNKEAGHGQGGEVKSVEEHMGSYMLHLTATNILFLTECEKALP